MIKKLNLVPALLLAMLCLVDRATAQQGIFQKKVDSLQNIIKNVPADSSKALAYADLGYMYLNFSPEKGIALVKKGLILADTANFLRGQAECYNNLGGLYDTEGDYQNALNAQIQSKVIHEKLKDELGIALNDANIANIYAHYGNEFNKSVKEEFRVKAVLEKIGGNEKKIIGLLNNIGDGYEHPGPER